MRRAVASLLVPFALLALAAPPRPGAAAEWIPRGTGAAPGHIWALKAGTSPPDTWCGSADWQIGRFAVCWDGVHHVYPHPRPTGFDGPFCGYFREPAGDGLTPPAPGQLYVCGSTTTPEPAPPLAPPPLEPGPAAGSPECSRLHELSRAAVEEMDTLLEAPLLDKAGMGGRSRPPDPRVELADCVEDLRRVRAFVTQLTSPDLAPWMREIAPRQRQELSEIARRTTLGPFDDSWSRYELEYVQRLERALVSVAEQLERAVAANARKRAEIERAYPQAARRINDLHAQMKRLGCKFVVEQARWLSDEVDRVERDWDDWSDFETYPEEVPWQLTDIGPPVLTTESVP